MRDTDLNDWLGRLGTTLREARLAAGLSFAEAAEASGASVSSVQRVEAGGTSVSAGLLARLCSAYGVEPAAVLPPLDAPAPAG